jgi:NADH:ubiquinone oxidoreductase subunit C
MPGERVPASGSTSATASPSPGEATADELMSDDADATREAVHEPARPDEEVTAAVLERFPASVFVDSHGQSVVYVDRLQWHDVARFLRDEERFTQCVDLTAVDHLLDVERVVPVGVAAERFEVVANFLSHPRNRRIRAICEIAAAEPRVDSLVDLYPSVAFAEREVFDLFGVTFAGHDDLARILMPDDWIGHPLRKDDAPSHVPVTFKEDPGPR